MSSKLKNRNRPESGFTTAAMRLAQAPTAFTVYSAPAREVKRKRVSADVSGLAQVDRVMALTAAAREQGKTRVGNVAIAYRKDGVGLVGFGSCIVWRDLTTGRFAPKPVRA